MPPSFVFGALAGLAVASAFGIVVAIRVMLRRIAVDPAFKRKVELIIRAMNTAAEENPARFWIFGSVCWASAIVGVFLVW